MPRKGAMESAPITTNNASNTNAKDNDNVSTNTNTNAPKEMVRAKTKAIAEQTIAEKKIAEKSAESEKALAEIREGAMESVREVARETAAALVAALGGTPDQKAIDSAVAERAKG